MLTSVLFPFACFSVFLQVLTTSTWPLPQTMRVISAWAVARLSLSTDALKVTVFLPFTTIGAGFSSATLPFEGTFTNFVCFIMNAKAGLHGSLGGALSQSLPLGSFFSTH